jgi:hypothetical protein
LLLLLDATTPTRRGGHLLRSTGSPRGQRSKDRRRHWSKNQ